MTNALAPIPLIRPLGDRGVLVRFGDSLSEAANQAAIGFAKRVERTPPAGVLEVVPNLISVLLVYDSTRIGHELLSGELRLLLSGEGVPEPEPTRHRIRVAFDGDDLPEVAAKLKLTPAEFVEAHNRTPLRVLATGFAPGFIYCGFHGPGLMVPRRTAVRASVPAGTVLFAAGQTAIASTPIPTGWHVIGHTAFRNFDAAADPPTHLSAGDEIVFEDVR
jgi:KipI family sensor histidine kinase inhibitor